MGHAKFASLKEYNKLKKALIDGGWATETSWLCEGGTPLGDDLDEPFDDKNLEIVFYGDTLRNVHRVMDTFRKVEWEGKLVGTSTDGCFEGWILTPKNNDEYSDLDEWAVSKGLGSRPDDEDDACEWQNEVEMQFMEDPYLPPPNSVKFINEDTPVDNTNNPIHLFTKE